VGPRMKGIDCPAEALRARISSIVLDFLKTILNHNRNIRGS
jgi:hypothetical protein